MRSCALHLFVKASGTCGSTTLLPAALARTIEHQLNVTLYIFTSIIDSLQYTSPVRAMASSIDLDSVSFLVHQMLSALASINSGSPVL
jgi:hypothetical protein